MNYQISQAEPKDAEEILFVQKSAYRSEAELYNDHDIPPLKQTVNELKKQFKDHVILKAVFNGKIMGTIRACEVGGSCYIGRIAVLPDMQNHGIGSALLKEIEGRFHPKRYELFTGSKSEKNIRFYTKAGYSVFKKAKSEHGNIEILYLEKTSPDS
jgi:ribosomal protein S18 acetylase RimI-like enzyme